MDRPQPCLGWGRVGYSMPRVTSVDLMRTLTGVPSANPRSSTASRVMEEVISSPPLSRIFTTAIASPRVIEVTVPSSWLRVLSRMGASLRSAVSNVWDARDGFDASPE